MVSVEISEQFILLNCIDIQPNSLKSILRQRQGTRQEESRLSERVKRFYQNQDELIDDYERVEKQANNDQEEQEKNDHLKRKTTKIIYILSRASFALNIVSTLIEIQPISFLIFQVLFLIKIIAAISSKSLSIILTVVDSAVDLASSIILFWASRAMKKRNPYLYSQGIYRQDLFQ
jgi:magnesium-transporting ATPase (P-type)